VFLTKLIASYQSGHGGRDSIYRWDFVQILEANSKRYYIGIDTVEAAFPDRFKKLGPSKFREMDRW
jgi:hypothetical protein